MNPFSTYTKFDYISGLILTTLWPIALSFVLLFVAPLGSLIKGRSYWKVELLTNIETPILSQTDIDTHYFKASRAYLGPVLLISFLV